MSTASSTVGSSSVVGTLPVWPPPSPPWIITASAPQAATFTACLAAPTLGITTMPASLSFAIRSCLGASANDATFTPSRISRSIRSAASPASARRFTPNGWSVRLLTSLMACSSSSYDIVALARMPRPPAFAVPLTRRGPETQPMPVCTIGWRTPASSVRGVLSCWSITVPRSMPAAPRGRAGSSGRASPGSGSARPCVGCAGLAGRRRRAARSRCAPRPRRPSRRGGC